MTGGQPPFGQNGVLCHDPCLYGARGRSLRVISPDRRRDRKDGRQSFRAAGTAPPFFSSSRITALCSQMFISAEPSFSPV